MIYQVNHITEYAYLVHIIFVVGANHVAQCILDSFNLRRSLESNQLREWFGNLTLVLVVLAELVIALQVSVLFRDLLLFLLLLLLLLFFIGFLCLWSLQLFYFRLWWLLLLLFRDSLSDREGWFRGFAHEGIFLFTILFCEEVFMRDFVYFWFDLF